MIQDSDFYIKNIYPNISKDKVVFTGDTAMVWNGVSVSGIYIPDVLTDKIELKGLRLAGLVNYCYVEKVDTINYLRKFNGLDNVYVPTIERAIVENIVNNLDFIDEGYFFDSFNRYIYGGNYNYKLLAEVAEFYGLDLNKLNWYIKEAKDTII